jgi:predicted RNA binding protein YcfA (HicA-like mRNA interferase family)
LDSRTILIELQKAGWSIVRIAGSHHHLRHDERPGTVTVPHPRKDVPIGTLRSIERQSGVKLRG